MLRRIGVSLYRLPDTVVNCGVCHLFFHRNDIPGDDLGLRQGGIIVLESVLFCGGCVRGADLVPSTSIHLC